MSQFHKIAYAILSLMFVGIMFGVFYIMQTDQPDIKNVFKLTSTAFDERGAIPVKYTCDGENVSPPLSIRNIPEGTKSLALIMDDPDIPDSVKQSRGIEVFDHWVLYNIPREVFEIAEGKFEGIAGMNGRGVEGYTGPCPPDKEHRYFFKLYALDVPSLTFVNAPTRIELETALQSHTIEKTILIGLYNRPR